MRVAVWLMAPAGAVAVVSTLIRLQQPRWRLRRVLWQIMPTPAHAAARQASALASVHAVIGDRAHRIRLCCGIATVAALAGLMVSGPVAAGVAATYAVAAIWALGRQSAQRAETVSGRQAMEAVGALAADLRAGLSVAAALTTASAALADAARPGKVRAAVARRVSAALDLAVATGAPLADVLDRLDHHLRAVERMHATARAQAAGAQASALLLAAMPIGGIAVGFVVGTNPLNVLLHTVIGAGCLAAGIALQLGGLAWSQRLTRVEMPV
jgi:tight adherence protein B